MIDKLNYELQRTPRTLRSSDVRCPMLWNSITVNKWLLRAAHYRCNQPRGQRHTFYFVGQVSWGNKERWGLVKAQGSYWRRLFKELYRNHCLYQIQRLPVDNWRRNSLSRQGVSAASIAYSSCGQFACSTLYCQICKHDHKPLFFWPGMSLNIQEKRASCREWNRNAPSKAHLP